MKANEKEKRPGNENLRTMKNRDHDKCAPLKIENEKNFVINISFRRTMDGEICSFAPMLPFVLFHR